MGMFSSHKRDGEPSLARRRRFTTYLAVAVALCLSGSLVYCFASIAKNSQKIAVSQISNLPTYESDDGSAKVTHRTADSVVLTKLLGMNEKDALAKVGHAPELVNQVIPDDSSVSEEKTYLLSDERVSSENKGIFLILGTDASGKVITAGYRAPFSALGFGAYSLSESIERAKVPQSVLEDAGVSFDAAVFAMPEDKDSYSTYESDGVTTVSQHLSFSGNTLAGPGSSWSAVVDYDYTEANDKRNLSYTRRYVEVRVHV